MWIKRITNNKTNKVLTLQVNHMGNSWLVTLRVQVDSDIVTKEEESGITHQDPGMDIVNTFIKGNLFNEDLMKEMAKEGISEV
jgi:hypothetical protein